MTTAQDIVRNALHRERLRERRAGETLRSVFRLDEAYIAKRFQIPLAARSFRRPWIAEEACLRRLDGHGAPRSFGWFEEIDADRRTVWLVKEYIPGTPLDEFTLEDLPAAARLLAHLHRRWIITDDAHPGNFIRTPSGEMSFLDFGRARRLRLPGPGRDLSIGWELAKLRREGFRWNRAHWEAFRPLYVAALGAGPCRRTFIRAACAAAIGLRMARKGLQGKSVWS
jgi:hypothetical protein